MKRRKRFDFTGCPRCGARLSRLSGLVTCPACGPLQRPLWGGHDPAIDRDVEYTCGRDYDAGYHRRSIRYEVDADNPNAVGDRPGKQTRRLDQ